MNVGSRRFILATISRWLLTFVLTSHALIPTGHAQIFTLVDGNAIAQIDVGSQSGMFNWGVAGYNPFGAGTYLNQLKQQWFWYRVGNSGPEASIDTIGPASVMLLNARTIYVTYASPLFSVEVDYVLTGGSVVASFGGTEQSAIFESISIINKSAAPLDFHFFQYSDFDLGGPGGDIVQLGRNLQGRYNEAIVSDSFVAFTETVTAPGADHGEANLDNLTRDKLNDLLPTVLNDNTGPVGPGDVTWAFEWDFRLETGGSFLIDKTKYMEVVFIPEPAGLALACLGIAAFRLCKGCRPVR